MRLATQPYRRSVDDHREPARPLQRSCESARTGDFATTELHHHQGRDRFPPAPSRTLSLRHDPRSQPNGAPSRGVLQPGGREDGNLSAPIDLVEGDPGDASRAGDRPDSDGSGSLKHATERLRISQNHANIGTWDWDLQTGTVFWSQPIAALFGLPDGAMETTFERFLDAVHPEDRQRVTDAATACIERGETYDLEHRCVWPDGTVRWLAERGDVLRDADGTPLNMLGVVQDVTDRKRSQVALAT